MLCHNIANNGQQHHRNVTWCAHVSQQTDTFFFFFNVFVYGAYQKRFFNVLRRHIYIYTYTYRINKHKKGHAFDLKTFFAPKRIYHCEQNIGMHRAAIK